MVHELGICVFVCIFASSFRASEGIFMCIGGGGGGQSGEGGGGLWAFYGCFVCLMGIQMLHNIRLWHHVACIFAARMAEYISAFRYILDK